MKLFFLLVLSTLCTITISGQTGKAPAGITYEKRTDILNAPRCNASEVYLKKKVKAQLATYYKDGYSDKEDAKRIVYPFKIEMLVYLKRNVMKEGKELTEYTIWKYDSEYEYATRPGKKCEFYIVPSSQITLITKQVF